MNWRENVNLFCTGEFQFMYQQVPYEITSWQPIIGRLELFHRPSGWIMEKHPTDVKLISRPISSLTDEETALFGRYGYADERQPQVWEDIRILISEHATKDFFSPSEFIQLLELGVYPFDQSHFKSGDVIDITTLKETV